MNITNNVQVFLSLKLIKNQNGTTSQLWSSCQTSDHDAELGGRHQAKNCASIIDALTAEFGRGNVDLSIQGVEHTEGKWEIKDATAYAVACVKTYLAKRVNQ